ncbi:33176_t:CDS:2 [Gigaspora margarita]|uniref:33176_t:CDS:1 n=1 Tax=Gigaspora margarita TaxID=4874 RepID=A0ABN7UIG1_GIGMA|nr:33176_t:CDS:2 [Gigaspora margarita]
MSHQALGNHIKKHLDDSDEDLFLPNQAVYTNVVEITNRVLNDQNKFEEQNLARIDTNYIKYNLNNNLEFFDYSDIQSNISDESTEERDIGLFDQSDHSDSQSNTLDGLDGQSDLSDITNVDINEYAEYDDLYTGKPRDLEDINQKFPSEEYTEFMHIVTQFRVQDLLANAFIRFFNKYSNCDDHPLPSTSQGGQAFIKDLNLLYFGWRKEIIFNYEGLEYMFEFRTVLNGIHQLLINKSITEEFIFEYKTSFNNLQNADNLWINGFKQLKHCIYDYFLSIENWTSYDIKHENILIKVFDFAYLDNDNRVIIRAVSNYYNQVAFSDVCIKIDELEQNDYLTDNGMCYAKKLELALVHWYDFAYPSNIKNHYFYKCAVLKFVEHYNLIPITSIANTIHIIPKFNKPGIFFINRYIDY